MPRALEHMNHHCSTQTRWQSRFSVLPSLFGSKRTQWSGQPIVTCLNLLGVIAVILLAFAITHFTLLKVHNHALHRMSSSKSTPISRFQALSCILIRVVFVRLYFIWRQGTNSVGGTSLGPFKTENEDYYPLDQEIKILYLLLLLDS